MGWYTPTATSSDLTDTLVCGWSARAEGEHLLVPDGCMDVLWIRGVGIRVCGPETSAWSFTLPPGTESVGVRFRPGAGSRLLATAASEIRNIRVPLADVLGSTWERRLLERLENAADSGERITAFEYAVRSWRAQRAEPDPLIDNVRTALARHSWNVRALADAASVTERQLQRRCNDAFGYGPATLRGILRLQRFMALAQRAPGTGLAELAAVAGYSDQAHLSRECRRISTLTPSALLAGEAPNWHGGASVVDVGNVQAGTPSAGEESAA
ncbi:MAG: helix-turn-helix domain-containing protein [Rhodococcus sp. (in: high G+C Gram-positive bacteria)]|uniref:helix-turn-helix domain-containing protein n=1 Tax=Rhodococcus sp. TaxID=1831 RepID=UPI003BB0A5AB